MDSRKDAMIMNKWVVENQSDKEEKSLEMKVEERYSSFNVKLRVSRYKDEIYETKFVRDGWSKLETDHLIDLCEDLDCRFPIVHDRYLDWCRENKKQEKTIEEIKERFYFVQVMLECNPVFQKKPISSEDSSNSSICKLEYLSKFPYNRKYEDSRAKRIKILSERNEKQISEEIKILEDFNKLNEKTSKFDKEKSKLMKLCEAVVTGEIPESIQNRSTQEKNFLKSTKSFSCKTLDPSTSEKVDSLLRDLHVELSPSSTASPSVVRAHQVLKNNLVVLLDLQPFIENKEYELRLRKSQNALLSEYLKNKK